MDLAQFTLQYDRPSDDVDSLKRAIANKLMYQIGKNPESALPEDWLHAVAYTVRDHLVERWMKTTRASYAQDVKRVYYLSMEFLIGRSLGNATLALELAGPVREALRALDIDPDSLPELEPDAALGNGGLGRLAACFLDSMATLGVPGFGYGIRYDYGMFRQQIVDGQQVEVPDYWLTHGNPWEFPRPEIRMRVRFGGHLQEDGGRVLWVGTDDVLAMAYDSIIPGYGTEVTNTLRLWSARATEEIDLSAFNRGNYFGAVESKNHSENVSRVLYPDDSTLEGRELRLRQEYFFVSASLQDILRRYRVGHRRLRGPARQGQHPPQRHPPGARGARADAPAGRRARAGVDARLGAVPAGVLLHQPHPDARGAGDLAAGDARTRAAAPPAHHLRRSTRTSSPSSTPSSGPTSSACAACR